MISKGHLTHKKGPCRHSSSFLSSLAPSQNGPWGSSTSWDTHQASLLQPIIPHKMVPEALPLLETLLRLHSSGFTPPTYNPPKVLLPGILPCSRILKRHTQSASLHPFQTVCLTVVNHKIDARLELWAIHVLWCVVTCCVAFFWLTINTQRDARSCIVLWTSFIPLHLINTSLVSQR